MAGYIRPKHTSLTLFINLFQECRLHPSHSMIWPLLDVVFQEMPLVQISKPFITFQHFLLYQYLSLTDGSNDEVDTKDSLRSEFISTISKLIPDFDFPPGLANKPSVRRSDKILSSSCLFFS